MAGASRPRYPRAQIAGPSNTIDSGSSAGQAAASVAGVSRQPHLRTQIAGPSNTTPSSRREPEVEVIFDRLIVLNFLMMK